MTSRTVTTALTAATALATLALGLTAAVRAEGNAAPVTAATSAPATTPAPAPAAAERKFPSPEWEAFSRALDVSQLKSAATRGRGRDRPADTAARELLRHLLHGRYSDPEQLVWTVTTHDAGGKERTEKFAEDPTLTMFGLALAPRRYLDAPVLYIVSDKLREKLFARHWESLPAGDPASDFKREQEKKRWLSPKRAFSYREILTGAAEVLEAPAASEAAAAPTGKPLTGKYAERLARLDEMDSGERGALRKELMDALSDRLGGGRGGMGGMGGMAMGGGADRDVEHLTNHAGELARKLNSFDNAGAQLMLVPTSSDPDGEWVAPDTLFVGLSGERPGPGPRGVPAVEKIALPTRFVMPAGLQELDEAGVRFLWAKWRELRSAFEDADPARADAVAAEVLSLCAGTHPTATLGAAGRPLFHPSQRAMSLEVFYNAWNKFVWVWVPFALAAVLLAAAMVFQSRSLLLPGLFLFSASVVVMVAAFAFRLLLAQRGSAFGIPISNQFESLLWGTFFATLAATGVAAWLRSWNSVACLIGACLMGIVVMGLSYFKPLGVSTEVTPETPVLRSALLPFHVGSMVGGYGLIALASLAGLVYLIKWFASGGGAEERIDLVKTDRFHMMLIRAVFFMLMVGLILGAAWGDVAWGRWWGWDPKETWAFITWLVYAIVLHARLIVRDRGPITAVLSVWGFAVMFFTWFGTNYGLTAGKLHAYSGVEGDSSSNMVPLIWLTLTILFPVAMGLTLAARSVHLSRTDPEAPRGANLALTAVLCWALTGAALGMLYLRYGATPAVMLEWVNPSGTAPITPEQVLPSLDPETAKVWVNRILLGLWTLITFGALSCTVGTVVALLARKTPATK
jgi:ABC-type transport system involved in cytochrome c biogenesis permease subunit